MEVNDLRVQMYNKVADLNALSHPQLLSDLHILEKNHYYKNINCFKVMNKYEHYHQLYVSKAPPKDVLTQIIFLKQSPKILYLKGDPESLVLEDRIDDRLSDYLVYHDEKISPYLPESYLRNILMDIIESVEDFLKHKLVYDCISPKNIVRMGQKWSLSTVGYIFNVDQGNPEYCHPTLKNPESALVYSLGSLLFKLVFGFPFSDNEKPYPKSPISFQSYTPYLEYLESVTKSKSLKIYYFIERFISVSPACLNLIEQSLSGTMSLEEWKRHEYFTLPLKYQSPLNDKNRELMMINSVDQKKLSLLMSSIEFKKKYPLQRLNPKPLPSPDEESYQQIIENYRKNILFRNLVFAPSFEKQQHSNVEQTYQINPNFIGNYFYENGFDRQEDYPCRQLLKFLEKDKESNPKYYKHEDSAEIREAELKLYAYPYAVAFQLLKVEEEQPIKIKRQIKQTIELLLELSSLHQPKDVRLLHNTKSQRYRYFSEMKTTFRENINELYRYFLNEAMRKYNVKKQTGSIVERLKKKEKGLEYYRICLKLIESSLIVRKKGLDLNLARIETSQRKQIQSDLENLLKNYFPTKAEIY